MTPCVNFVQIIILILMKNRSILREKTQTENAFYVLSNQQKKKEKENDTTKKKLRQSVEKQNEFALIFPTNSVSHHLILSKPHLIQTI